MKQSNEPSPSSPPHEIPKRSLLAAVSVAALAILACASLVLAGQGVLHHLSSSEPGTLTNVVTTVVGHELVTQLVTGDVHIAAGYSRAVTGNASQESIYTRPGIAAGQSVEPGAVIAVLNERPIIALVGAIPAYRALALEDTGEDVRQLQNNLNALGLTVPETGTFTRATARAVNDLFQARGFAALDASGVPVTQPTKAGVPFGSIQFFPSLPAIATSQCGSVGTPHVETVCTLQGGAPVVQASISNADVLLVELGMTVDVEFSDGTHMEGSVAALEATVAPRSSSEEADDDATASPKNPIVELEVPEGAILDFGMTGRASILISKSDKADLSVESSAIRSDDTGKSWLVDTAGEQVHVELGLCGSGRCVIAGDGVEAGMAVRLSTPNG